MDRRRLTERGHRGIRDTIVELIDAGEIPAGARLPTVRALATAVGVTPTTVADAWRALRADGRIETRRRGGTIVRPPVPPGTADFAGWTPIELVHAQPDAALLPSVDATLVAAVRPSRRLFEGDHITEHLAASASKRWAFPAEAFTTIPTGNLALRLAVTAAASGPDAIIAVEDPTLLRGVWMLADFPGRTIPVRTDADGPVPASLAAALQAGASVFLHQPHGGIPAGRILSPSRRDELADVIAGFDRSPWIIEEHPNAGLVEAWDRGPSLGAVFPERTLRLAQYWRAFGPDLELSVVGGAGELIGRIAAEQSRYGIRSSALLQDALARLLADEAATDAARTAADAYDRRRRALATALERLGMADHAAGGLFSWIPVADEEQTLTSLRAIGVHVVAGGTSWVTPDPPGHIRIAVTRLPDDPLHVEELAAAIAMAAGVIGTRR